MWWQMHSKPPGQLVPMFRDRVHGHFIRDDQHGSLEQPRSVKGLRLDWDRITRPTGRIMPSRIEQIGLDAGLRETATDTQTIELPADDKGWRFHADRCRAGWKEPNTKRQTGPKLGAAAGP